MYGSILYGASIYGDRKFGIYATEITVNLSQAQTGVLVRNRAVFSSLPAKARIPDLDLVINLATYNSQPRLCFCAYGSFEDFGTTINAGIGLGNYAVITPGYLVASGPVQSGIRAVALFRINSPDDNAISWSNIGSLDFTKALDNVAGKKPLDWRGYVYKIKMIGLTNKALVYGVNGISVIVPSDVYYGERKVFPIGIKNKQAMIDTLNNHFFISSIGDLWSVDGNVKFTNLGYKEFLSSLNAVVMSYDSQKELIYICDGTIGYVYSILDDSLTNGYPTITGINTQDSVNYVFSPSTLTQPIFSITSDIVNFGTRKNKTIDKVEIETDYTGTLSFGVDYRLLQNQSFSSSPWLNFYGKGEVTLPCYGVDFKFKIKALENGVSFNIKEFNVFGIVHNFTYRDYLKRS